MKTLYTNAHILTMDDKKEYKNGEMLIENGKIKFVGNKCDIVADYKIDVKGKIIMPSFINTHCHSAMTLLRGYGEGQPLQKWLFDYVFPIEDNLDDKIVYDGCMLAFCELVKFGITSISDMYFFCDAIADASIDFKIKNNISRSISCTKEQKDYTKYYSYSEAKNIFDKYNNASNGLIKAEYSLHSQYTTNEGICASLIERAKADNAGIHIHISETKSDHDDCVKKYGMTQVEYFDKLGLFNEKTNLAHGVWLTDNDMDILSKRKSNVSHCPISNLKLASGIADITKMIDKNINVSLGTDSVCSNNNFNFFEEIKMASLLQRGTKLDAALINSYDALKMATVNGAITQGRQNECGKLKVGFDADFIIINNKNVNMLPSFNAYDTILFSATSSDIEKTVCRGETLYENGEFKTIDYEKVLSNFNKSFKKLYS